MDIRESGERFEDLEGCTDGVNKQGIDSLLERSRNLFAAATEASSRLSHRLNPAGMNICSPQKGSSRGRAFADKISPSLHFVPLCLSQEDCVGL